MPRLPLRGSLLAMVALLPWLIIAAASCPSPQAVEEKVARLGSTGRPWDITFTRRGEVVLLEASNDGVTLTRELPSAVSCEALEEAAAVILVTHSPDVGVMGQAVRHQRIVLRPRSSPTPRPLEAPAMRLAAGFGPSLVLCDSGPGLGAVAYLGIRSTSFPVAVGVALSGAGLRSLALGGGELSWGRLSIGLGPELPLARASANVTVWTHVATGALWLSARDIAEGRDVVSWDLGVRAGARLEVPASGALHLFVGLSGTAWVLRHRALLVDSTDSVQLPWLELDVSGGVSWRG